MIFLLNFVHFEAIFAYSETDLLILKQKSPTDLVEDSLFNPAARRDRSHPVRGGRFSAGCIADRGG